jgi:hypothetical protein
MLWLVVSSPVWAHSARIQPGDTNTQNTHDRSTLASGNGKNCRALSLQAENSNGRASLWIRRSTTACHPWAAVPEVGAGDTAAGGVAGAGAPRAAGWQAWGQRQRKLFRIQPNRVCRTLQGHGTEVLDHGLAARHLPFDEFGQPEPSPPAKAKAQLLVVQRFIEARGLAVEQPSRGTASRIDFSTICMNSDFELLRDFLGRRRVAGPGA